MLAGRRGAVFEDVSEVRVAVLGTDFRADNEEFAVALRHLVRGLEQVGEARPAGFGVVLVDRAEQRLARHDVDVDPLLVIVPVFVAVGANTITNYHSISASSFNQRGAFLWSRRGGVCAMGRRTRGDS